MENLNENKNGKGLVVLVVVLALLLCVAVGYICYDKFLSGDKENEVKEEITYKVIEDSPQVILGKVFNEKMKHKYSISLDSGKEESLFENKTEVLAENLSIETKMTIALYSIDFQKNTISCDSDLDEPEEGLDCGGFDVDTAYFVTSDELNKKMLELFNESIDYSKLDLDKLGLGSCADSGYVFRYNEEKSLFISMRFASSCTPNKKLEITNVTKTQEKDILTLDVYYNTSSLNWNSGEYEEIKNHHDKFKFKVKSDGTYYFYSSVTVE